MTPRGLRNANPGNIRAGEKWHGLVGVDDAGFCIFDKPENGLRALCKVLLAYRDRHGLRTVEQIIGRWAPPNENNTPAYVAAVARELGVDPSTPLAFDLPCLANLAAAITRHENGQQPYSRSMLEAGAAAALGTTPPEAPVLPAIIPALLPSIVSAIPALAQIFGSGSEVSTRNLKAAQVVADTVVAATQSVNLQEAAEKMKADENARQAAQIAVLAQPQIMALLEVGGGVDAARKANIALMQATDAWWKALLNPVLVVTALTLPLVYIIVVELVKQMPKVSPDVIAQTIGTVVGIVLGGIVGFWMGQTYQSSGAQNRRAADQPK